MDVAGKSKGWLWGLTLSYPSLLSPSHDNPSLSLFLLLTSSDLLQLANYFFHASITYRKRLRRQELSSRRWRQDARLF